jgi:glycosyltransferase involved in cell wall biosynthesis
MRVGLLIYGPLDGRSGGYRYDLELVRRLRRRGDEVTVLSLPERSVVRSLADNLSRPLRRRLREADFDVLLQDELCHPSLALLNDRVDLPYPVVSVVHHLRASEPGRGVRRRAARHVEARYLRSVDAYVCNSETTRATVAAFTDPTPSVVAPPAGDRFGAPVGPDRIRERAGERPLRVVAVGTVTPRKNLHLLLRGLAAADADWHLTVVGDPTVAPGYASRLRGLVRTLDVTDRVTFAGRLDDDALSDVLDRCHVFALPSTYEGFGIAYVEAMGFGLPVVASAAGGATELVTDGREGFLVDPASPVAVTEAVETLSADRDRLVGMGLAARERFRSHPTWDETAATVRRFLRGLR